MEERDWVDIDSWHEEGPHIEKFLFHFIVSNFSPQASLLQTSLDTHVPSIPWSASGKRGCGTFLSFPVV